jgi:hypothetical protein
MTDAADGTDWNRLQDGQPIAVGDTVGSTSYARDVDSWLALVPSVGVLWRY